jgi:hypothetical protein
LSSQPERSSRKPAGRRKWQGARRVLLQALGFEGFLTMQAIRSPRNCFQSARIDVVAACATLPEGAFIDAVQGALDQAQASLKLTALLEELSFVSVLRQRSPTSCGPSESGSRDASVSRWRKCES